MSTLPLVQKLKEDNLFVQLNLPLSSKWPEIKKAYDTRALELASSLKSEDAGKRKESEQKLNLLKSSYQSFASRVSNENTSLHQTKDSLKSLGLNETSDWDKVNRKIEEIRRTTPEKVSGLQPHIDSLNKNKALLKPQSKFGGQTLVASAAALGAAGISLVAYHYLSQEEKEGVVEELQKEDAVNEGAANAVFKVGGVDQQALEDYIRENTAFEDEIFSLMGFLPSPQLSLSLQYKMHVFSALLKNV